MKRTSIVIVCILTVGIFLDEKTVNAQDVSNQIWVGILPHYTFKDRLQLQAQFDYRHVTNQDDNWSRFFSLYDFRFSTLNRLDFHFGSFLLYTSHNDLYSELDGWEIRPFIGARFHLTQNKRVNIRNYIRSEERLFFYTELKEWKAFTRFRDRIEILTAITQPNLNEDRLLYFNLDGELFINVGGDPAERFANLFQIRVGPGYRFNYEWRVETFYILQSTRNSANDSFDKNANIVSLRFRYFFIRK